MSEIKLAIFDLDGTLLDTLDSLAGAFNETLVSMNAPPRPVSDYRTIIGDGALVAAERCLPAEMRTAENIESCRAGFSSRYEATWQSAMPYDGIRPMLEGLRSRVHLAVLSNKDEAFTHRCIEHFFPGDFSSVVGHSRTIAHKPDPTGARAIMAGMQLSPEETVMIGDTATDMATACACGMTGIGVLWGFRDAEELTAAGAKHLVAAPSELIPLIR